MIQRKQYVRVTEGVPFIWRSLHKLLLCLSLINSYSTYSVLHSYRNQECRGKMRYSSSFSGILGMLEEIKEEISNNRYFKVYIVNTAGHCGLRALARFLRGGDASAEWCGLAGASQIGRLYSRKSLKVHLEATWNV